MLPHDGQVLRILKFWSTLATWRDTQPRLCNFCKSSDEYGVPGKARRKITQSKSQATSEPSPSLDMVANFVMGGRRRRCFARRLRAVVELAAEREQR